MQEDGSDAGSVAEVPPQTQITMLLNKRDFESHVCQDKSNLCCVFVTSTLCRQCGIRRIPYPKAPARHSGGAGADGDDEDVRGEDAEAEGDDEDDNAAGDGDGARNGHGGASTGHFFREIEDRLVRRAATVAQRRNVRFFHVCACAAEETCVDFLISADPAYTVLNKKPSPQEVAQLHQTAYDELSALLTLLKVRSTPYMCFFLAGQPLRYSMMASASGGAGPSGVTEQTDVVVATGANHVKWARVLENAVVVRNAVMRDFDTAERESARLARVEAKRVAREARKHREAEDGEEEEDDE